MHYVLVKFKIHSIDYIINEMAVFEQIRTFRVNKLVLF